MLMAYRLLKGAGTYEALFGQRRRRIGSCRRRWRDITIWWTSWPGWWSSTVPPAGVGFLQRVTPEIGTAFQPVEDELRKAFLLELFKGDTTQIPRRAFTSLPVKQSGIALPDPTQTAVAE